MGKIRIWTAEENKQLKALYPTSANRELAEIFGVSYSSIKNKANHMKLKKNEDHKNGGQYNRGHVPWITGKKGILMPGKYVFPKGHRPYNTMNNGDITIRKSNHGYEYKFIRISAAKWIHLHVYVWVQHYGPVPKGMMVIFEDGDKMNCRIRNLKLISKKDNALRNSGSIHLADGFIVHCIAGKDKHLKDDIKQNKELIDLKRQSIILNRKINERAKSENSKSTG